ncbi:MAG TPA: NmrA family NAD(P)-binding protein [Myxococcota bacterium]|nr:NmrA family NAD(P)-binding protein [Myxococcota bacterium]HRY92192.1 NmrA family NAD(P)-binding protein [Myxococcota bacterium]HSA21873.1 NmrA family NAD(P)-binding protein [Myxococcota bacterium]
MTTPPLAVVTGAFSYSGSAIARALHARGFALRTLTNRATPLHPFDGPIDVQPLQFGDEGRLAASLRGARLLVNTYWVRYARRGVGFEQAIRNTGVLLRAARAAGLERVVHLSVSNPSPASPLAYYRGKAEVERLVAAAGLPHAIVRPTLVVGARDVLVNNIAWFLRRLPVFAMPGSGSYRVQPVALDELGELVAEAACSPEPALTLDAAGPDTISFEELVRAVARAIGVRPRIVHVPGWLSLAALGFLGLFLGEPVLTRAELAGLRAELLVSHTPPRGRTSVLAWLAAHGQDLGRAFASEQARHFRRS